MNNFGKFEKLTIRWIALSTLRTTAPCSSVGPKPAVFGRVKLDALFPHATEVKLISDNCEVLCIRHSLFHLSLDSVVD